MSKTLLSVNNYNYARGGAETVFLHHNQLMEDQGWSVTPFAMQHPLNLPSAAQSHFVSEIEFGSDYSWLEKLRMAPKVVYSFEAKNKISQLIDAVNPDICHAHNIYHHLSPSIFSAVKSRGIPVAMTVHDLKIACPAYKMLTHDGICERCKGGNLRHVVKNRCIKQSLALSSLIYVESWLHHHLSTYRNQIDRFLVPSRFYISKLIEWGFSESQMSYVPNHISTDSFQVRNKIGDYFAFVGRLAPEKGLETLLAAVRHAGVKVKVVGTGPDEAKLKAMADTLGVQAEFTGSLAGDALKGVISDALALVLPSEWYENAPMSVLEAYATGVPVIGADIGGIPEMIDDGVTGYVFPTGSVSELAQRLSDFSQLSEMEILVMGEAARATVEGRFSKEVYIENVLQIYRELMPQSAWAR